MPSRGHPFTCADYGVALFVALIAAVLYVRTLGPTITGEDSGEFVVAAHVLGIPHPPGYPLYCLMAHPFTWLPFGEVAWRVNLVSAMFASGAAFLTVLLAIYLTRNRVAALAAGLALVCSREFWAQAVIAEVYTMNVFWVGLCLLLLLRWSDTRRQHTLFLLAFIFGLGTTVHNTFLLLIPPFVVYVLVCDWQAGALNMHRLNTYLLLGVSAATGLLVYVYLPLRSRTSPPLDWGNPENLHNLYHVVRRSQYDFMFHQYPRSLERFLGQMGVYGRLWLGAFMPWGALFGCWGLTVLARRHLLRALLLLLLSLCILAGFSFWQNFEQTREWLWVMRVFVLPVYLVTALGIALGLDCLWRVGNRGKMAAMVMAILCIVPSLLIHWHGNDKSDYFWTRDYGANILETLAPDALYVSESDHGSFSVLYLQTVLGMRPDVENLRKYGYLESPLFSQMPESLRTEIGAFPKRRHEPAILTWLLENTRRPLYLANPRPLPGMQLEPAGLLFRVLRPGEHSSGRDYWNAYQWTTLLEEDTRGDYTAEAIRYEIQIARAHGLFITARKAPDQQREVLQQEALAHIESALDAYGRDPVVLNNAGVVCARYGFYAQGKAYFSEALERLPHMTEPRRNLARIEERLS